MSEPDKTRDYMLPDGRMVRRKHFNLSRNRYDSDAGDLAGKFVNDGLELDEVMKMVHQIIGDFGKHQMWGPLILKVESDDGDVSLFIAYSEVENEHEVAARLAFEETMRANREQTELQQLLKLAEKHGFNISKRETE